MSLIPGLLALCPLPGVPSVASAIVIGGISAGRAATHDSNSSATATSRADAAAVGLFGAATGFVGGSIIPQGKNEILDEEIPSLVEVAENMRARSPGQS
tara:strand:- start:9922 stop:10218 length:297 start_codon:yes stop_codon:yes gene_type:complete